MSVFEHEHEYSKIVSSLQMEVHVPPRYTNCAELHGSLKETNAYIHISYLHSPNPICLINAMPSEPSLSNNPFNIAFLLGKLLPRELSQATRTCYRQSQESTGAGTA